MKQEAIIQDLKEKLEKHTEVYQNIALMDE